jgi:hypothetical protein
LLGGLTQELGKSHYQEKQEASKALAVTVAPIVSQQPTPASAASPKKPEERLDPSKCKFGLNVVTGEDELAHYQAKHPKGDASTMLPQFLLPVTKVGSLDFNIPLPVDLDSIPDVEKKGEPVCTSILLIVFFSLLFDYVAWE